MQKFWWINLLRGVVALIIGILLLTWFQVAHDLFANFLAMYWLSSGLLGLRGGLSTHQKKGWWLVVDVLEMVVGAAILLRPVYAHLLASELAIKLFGLIALCVGLVRIFSRTTYRNLTREQSLSIHLLGWFEIGLGLFLIFSSEIEPFTELLAGGWTFLGGAFLILQSLQLHKASIIHS
ncbi:hypothetical protein KSF_091960 [Reticulibacter mediterranei]|uniref:Uncharacterized protein n=1 Tax=Reticulibacter mediterranei TaxID=2778369 RepID=A0A8J3IV78_9CHLR|nr:DUF308 domain-containing protein [Reticulibacter mediterranei]GHO99148.1 hypothetical protein KSF_091960 [Reticulibacter mediterranei]